MKDTQPILIVSTGRTGTIFLARLFSDLYPMVASYHERGNSRPIQILTNLYFSHLLPLRVLRSAWKYLKGQEIAGCEKDFHIDANNFLYGLAALAPDLYPNLKVLHIVRDPRDYVTSQLNFSRQKHTSFIGNYLVPFWQPNPFLVGELPMTQAFNFSRFQKYCWVWDFKNRIISRLEGYTLPYLCIRFEDLFEKDPETTFKQITDFIGLPPVKDIRRRFSEPANSSKSTFFPEWHNWSPRQAAQLDTLCGKQMRRYGYGSEPEWLQKIQSEQ
ncbi:MAG: sulfotransferase domain-containing protein [Anaerolineales bacterium]|nr:sulfotransferase domain-containing protein [Anaerolineales bacterium]